MAVNLAGRYSDKVDERFRLRSFTENWLNNEYEFEGVSNVTVYSIDVQASLVAYTRTGVNRYGSAFELGDSTKTYTLTRDRAFTFTIDKGNKVDSMNVRDSGRALSRQINEVVIPEIDIYRLGVWSATAVLTGQVPTATNITASNAYSSFLTAQASLDNAKVPVDGRVAFVSPSYYNFIKLDPTFTKNADSAYKDLRSGVVGDIDGVTIVKVPASYLPAKTPFILAHKSTMLSPQKLAEYKTHDNPPGINGALIEGRIFYDSFVLEAKKLAVYAWKEV
jgi:N4-gp56 family major capsid protein